MGPYSDDQSHSINDKASLAPKYEAAGAANLELIGDESDEPVRLFVKHEHPRSLFTKDSVADTDEVGKELKESVARPARSVELKHQPGEEPKLAILKSRNVAIDEEMMP